MLELRASEVFYSDVREFSIYDCERSIPSGIDGFKPSQRKIIYGMIKKFGSSEVKVSIASAGIMEVSCYHHGDLSGVIVNMAQSFPGSNNLPFLEPIGQFGSRIGPMAAAPRYIFTRLSESFRKLFRKEDEMILNYQEDDGTVIEPDYYLPIIPNVLVNGSKGMGTGFACSILNYNPEDIRLQCLAALTGKKRQKLVPYYEGFKGKIEKVDEQTVFTGILEVVNTTTIKISELPIGKYTKAYREVLNKLEENGLIKTYDDNSSEDKTEFIISCPRELTRNKSEEELLNTFKLISKESENVTVWQESGKLRKFDSVDDLLTWFVEFRVTKYEERRLAMIRKLEIELTLAQEKIRFIRFYIKNSKWFSENKKDAIEARLKDEGFISIDTLMSIKVYNLTKDQIEKLEEAIEALQAEINFYKDTTAEAMYVKELKELKF